MPYENDPMRASEIQDDLESLKDDLANLRDDLGELMKSVISAGRGRAEDVRDRLQEQLKDRVERISRRGEETVDTVQHQLESHPMIAIGSAFGLGLVLGALMRKS